MYLQFISKLAIYLHFIQYYQSTLISFKIIYLDYIYYYLYPLNSFGIINLPQEYRGLSISLNCI